MKNTRIGFIGQGFIGKNYADDFEDRGYEVIRYSKEKPHDRNKETVGKCDIVFIAVPTPTTPEGYDVGIIRNVIPLTKAGSIVVIKSTMLPGMTKIIQQEFPHRIIMHSPEFLSEVTATYDAAHPFMNIIGLTKNNESHQKAAELVHSTFRPASFSKTVSSEEAELIKYTHNCSGFAQIIFFNLMYDLALKMGADWKNIKEALEADPFVSTKYASPVHKSGRGAGGHCFIKDMAAFREVYEDKVGDLEGVNVIASMEEKNKSLLRESKKDLELMNEVYGEDYAEFQRK